jgi:hypothetical protein
MTSERVPRTYSAALDAVVTGYRDHLRRQPADHDDQRTTFVDDLLTGRADPGHLAERAHRYGICLSGTHVVAMAVGPALPAPSSSTPPPPSPPATEPATP